MKLLCRDRGVEHCDRLREILEGNGIACLVKAGEPVSLFEGRSDNPVSPLAELWVVEDAQFDEAWSFLNRQDSPDDLDGELD